MHGERCGFTVVEVLVAVVVLTVGVLALVGAAAGTSRMVARGKHSTVAAAVLAARIEWLRHIAGNTRPGCSAPEWRSGSADELGVSLDWEVLDPAGAARRVRLILRGRSGGTVPADTVITGVLCPAG